MGMAASQARFLGLTARKSNVEYQGQQINQQRTALSNESANLYNQMLDLTVPTPPSSSDYYETTYVVESSSDGTSDDYTILNMTRTYNSTNDYVVTLSTQVSNTKSSTSSYTYSLSSLKDSDGNSLTAGSCSFSDVASATIALSSSGGTLTYNSSSSCLKTSDDETTVSITANTIYEVPSGYEDQITGYSTCLSDLQAEDEESPYYFYQDSSGNNHFLTKTELESLFSSSTGTLDTYRTTTYYTTETIDVNATLETSDSGRVSSITILDGDNVNTAVPSYLKGQTFSVSTTSTKNEDAYEDAMNDYYYEKEVYEKAISDINAQTEVIQQEDQQLELRLDQLDTEQNAIATEIDSVSKVIEDNIEQTFKIFA